jgi:flagellar biosynthesis/type III secretory pathway protein FliH
MPATLTIHLPCPVAATRVVDVPDASAQAMPAAGDWENDSRDERREGEDSRRAQELDRLCAIVKSVSDRLNGIYEETISRNQKDIARLAVEIARKVLASTIARNDHDIQGVVEEALKRVPTRQHVVVRMNPEDLRICQQLQQENPDGPLGGLELVGDASVARADCVVETPKGIVK